MHFLDRLIVWLGFMLIVGILFYGASRPEYRK